LILLTVGSMFPFDRLVQAVDELVAAGKIEDDVHAQIGTGRYEPRAMPFDRFLDKPQFDALLRRASCIVSHAGIGSIATALKYEKPMLVLPRLRRHGEHVNDHQVATAQRYEQLGHVLVAYTEAEIPERLTQLKRFRPKPRSVNACGVAQRVGSYLQTLQRDRGGR
jgi:UDP-N-acetylglucosamine transferase subunit ALG13